MTTLPTPRVLAVIPARGGSKGLPGKNVRSLAGLPLVAHSIKSDCMLGRSFIIDLATGGFK